MNKENMFVLSRRALLLLSIGATVYSNGSLVLENAALNKPTTQGPSTHRYLHHFYESSFAVDGKISTLFPDCAGVDTANVMWWTVDLIRSRKIHKVRILTRFNSDFRRENFTIDGFHEDPTQASGFQRNFGQICTSRVDQLDAGVFSDLACSYVMETRFVRIVKHGYAHLALCEVQVLAEVLGNEAAYKVVPKSSAQIMPKETVGKFNTATSCAVALAGDKEHNGFQFKSQAGECIKFQTSPFRGDNSVDPSTSWDLYTVL
ncbi:hypothetical protein EGW08_014918 [Elysia chlorotica]|uniref:Fucolectin tachylectin-4 pentraxin-1 domain-containing protein n=1 Tax=Elysia chlorotica TaxID=188477 RepID=A0A433T6W2_ELYCH|nr:hypothetical protein EGW08_014918 [Elysia chlorotica]